MEIGKAAPARAPLLPLSHHRPSLTEQASQLWIRGEEVAAHWNLKLASDLINQSAQLYRQASSEATSVAAQKNLLSLSSLHFQRASQLQHLVQITSALQSNFPSSLTDSHHLLQSNPSASSSSSSIPANQVNPSQIEMHSNFIRPPPLQSSQPGGRWFLTGMPSSDQNNSNQMTASSLFFPSQEPTSILSDIADEEQQRVNTMQPKQKQMSPEEIKLFKEDLEALFLKPWQAVLEKSQKATPAELITYLEEANRTVASNIDMVASGASQVFPMLSQAEKDELASEAALMSLSSSSSGEESLSKKQVAPESMERLTSTFAVESMSTVHRLQMERRLQELEIKASRVDELEKELSRTKELKDKYQAKLKKYQETWTSMRERAKSKKEKSSDPQAASPNVQPLPQSTIRKSNDE